MNLYSAASRAIPRRSIANASSINPTASLPAILLSILVLVAPAAHAQINNLPPTADPQSVSTPEDTPRSIELTGLDPEGAPLTFEIVADPSYGTWSGTPPNVTYMPNENFYGTDVFLFTVSDGDLSDLTPATVTINVTPVNDPPTARPDSLTVQEDSTLNNPANRVDVTENDDDPDGDSLNVTGASANNGTTEVLSNGNIAYSPNANYWGSDTISYTVSDGTLTASSTVAVTVNAVPDAPVANNDTGISVDEDSSDNVIDVTANDTDADGEDLTVVAASASNGTATPAGGSVRYTPPADFSGEVTISYTIEDESGLTDSATASVTVRSVNDPPVANDDTASVDEDSSNNVINVTANDTDPEGDTLTVRSANAADGNATPDGGSVRYTPPPDFNGTTTINYTISDGNGGEDSATVTVTVRPVIDPPTARNDSATVNEGGTIDGTLNVLDNDVNPEDDETMTAVLASGPAHASQFTLRADGTFVYRHNGGETTSDSFTYRADNGKQSEPATVSITVNPVNDAPRFAGVEPPGLSTPEDTTLTIVIGDLVINDPDSTTFTLTLEPPLPDANYTLAPGPAVAPAANFNGQLNVRATVSDGEASSAPFTIPVEVQAVNDRPNLVEPIGAQNAVEDSPFTLDVSGNFADADGDSLTYVADVQPPIPPERGISFDGATGRFSGTPAFNDDDPEEPIYAVTITASDEQGEFVADTFDLTISQLGRANLGLEITVSPETATPNEQLRWTFTTNNPIGPAPGANVELSGSFLGIGLTVGVVGGANCTVNTQAGRVDFTCSVGAVPIGETVAVQLSTAASEATEVVALAMTAGTQPIPIDPNLGNNSAVRAVGVAESFSQGAVQILGDAAILSMAAGDVNGDGTPDIVAGTESGLPVQIYLGAEPRESCGCQRDFEAAPLTVPDTGANRGVALADFDNNGTLDLVIVNSGGQPDTVYANDGAGNFSLAATLAPSNGRDVAVGDFDNDGNLDIAVAAGGPNPVYFGDGAGGFSPPVLLGDQNSNGVAVGRFNGDNLDDLVFANIGAASRIWTATAGGGFAEVVLPTFGDAASVAAADLNNDGLDDLVFGRVPAGMGDIPSNPVFLNQGAATFGAPAAELGLSPTRDVLIGDVSEDGQLDIVFINDSGLHQRWSGSGGEFTLYSEQIIDIGAVAGVIADLGFADNGDPGGLDLALGGAVDAGVGVYLNDSAGNLGFGDAVPPVITLVGAAAVEVPAGTAYTDAGATAEDNIDGALEPTATSNLNTSVVGSYTVTYNVTDRAGNAAAPVSRTVNVTAASGRGGGGGGAIGYWILALLAAAHIWVFMHSPARSRQCRIAIDTGEAGQTRRKR